MTNTDLSCDVLIVGAGVVGCVLARELARYRCVDTGAALKIGVLEKEGDVSLGTSCRNSGVVHSGINYRPGTLRAVLNVKGNAMMDGLCADLKVPLKRIGKLTVALTEGDLPGLYKQKEQGEANGVPGMELMDNAKMRTIQPGIEGILGLWTPSSAIILPYGLTISAAENAHLNGVRFHLGRRVEAIRRREDGVFEVSCRSGSMAVCETCTARVVVNSAGLHADEVSALIGIADKKIWACRGEYYVLDRRLDGSLKTLIYPVPGPNDPGLGIHLTPTVDGNILIGPSATYMPDEDREDYRATADVMADLRREGLRLLPDLAASDFIRSFSGNRPKQTPPEVGGNADFTIEETRIPGYIHLLGIESPGLTSSPAIAEMVRDLIAKRIPLAKRDDFVAEAERPRFVGRFAELPPGERRDLVASDPEYGEIICRCEHITKREVRDAIENPLGARVLAGIKYRARAMTGRCQGGFCIPRIVRMLRDEYGYRPEDFLLRSPSTPMFAGHVREEGGVR